MGKEKKVTVHVRNSWRVYIKHDQWNRCPTSNFPAISKNHSVFAVPAMGRENTVEEALNLLRSRLCNPSFVFKPLSDSPDSNYRSDSLSILL